MKSSSPIASQVRFFLVAIGSAGGLGNLWRFPAIVGLNGGGAFVLVYIFLVLVLGLPLIVGELMLGKFTGKSVCGALSALPKNRGVHPWVGRASVFFCALVLAYYSVVSGWVLYFSIRFFLALLNIQSAEPTSLGLSHVLQSSVLQAGLTIAHVFLIVFIVVKGVQKGLERYVSWTIPLFAILLLVLLQKSLALPSAASALRFLFYPDFSKLSFHSLGQAVGQVLFTLSLGFGTMVTLGSYMNKDEVLPAGVRVTLVDTVISILSGLLIFPIVLSSSRIPVGDPGLLFEAMPQFLLQTSGGLLFGFGFFLCLYLAAVGASIGLMEVIVANSMDRRSVSRRTASFFTGLIVLCLSLTPLIVTSIWSKVRWGQMSLLEVVDVVVINFALPLLALGVSISISQGISIKEQEKQFMGQGKTAENEFMFKFWKLALKFFVPGVIVLGLIGQVI